MAQKFIVVDAATSAFYAVLLVKTTSQVIAVYARVPMSLWNGILTAVSTNLARCTYVSVGGLVKTKNDFGQIV